MTPSLPSRPRILPGLGGLLVASVPNLLVEEQP
jgi:hypothetical protein